MAVESWREWARKSVTTYPANHLAVDLDDVCLDFTGGVRAEVEREFGVPVPEFHSWDIKSVLNPIIGRSWWSWMKERSEIWTSFAPIPGALDALAALRADGWHLEILTSKPKWAEANVWEWLALHKPPVQQVTIVTDKDLKSHESRARILIDDRPKNVEDWVVSDGVRSAILFERDHNLKHTPVSSRVQRAAGWDEVQALLKEFKR